VKNLQGYLDMVVACDVEHGLSATVSHPRWRTTRAVFEYLLLWGCLPSTQVMRSFVKI
jgi:hypothetical protein